MRSALFHVFTEKRAFWRRRSFSSRVRFLYSRGMFGVKHRVRENGKRARLLLVLLNLVLWQIAVALAVAIGFQWTDPYVAPRIEAWFGFNIPAGEEYGTLVATIAGVGGVFIGLYYAAISATAGATYARVSNNIRDLLAQDLVGNMYMRCLAHLTSLGVFLLSFHALGLKPVILAVPWLLLCAGFSIFAFVRLGSRAFNLFDPTNLSEPLFEQLRECYGRAQSGGYRWSDRSFQNHSHEVAQTAIDTLATLSDITAKQPHLNGRPFADLCKGLLAFLIAYEKAKRSIPTDSLWYEKRYIYPDWYRTGDTQTSTAHQTSTMLQPQSTSDSRWIETAILPIVQSCLEINIRENRYRIVYGLFRYIDLYVRCLAEEHQVEFAFSLMRDISASCEKFIFVKKEGIDDHESLEHLRIYDRLASMPISTLVAYGGTVESCGRDTIPRRIRRIEWKSEKSVYSAGFPKHLLEHLEWLRPRIGFECEVEGRVISPPWYLQELIAQAEAEHFTTVISCFHNEARELYEHWSETATSSKHSWLVAAALSREWEYWHKVGHWSNALIQFWNNLNAERRIEGLPWPSSSTDKLIQKKEQREKNILKLMSSESLLLSLTPRPKSHPDFAGQFLHTVGEALLAAMCENDCNTVEMLSESYFYANTLQYERQKPKKEGPISHIEHDFKVAVAPLLDLIDISGYAFLMSAYHDAPQLKRPILKEWDSAIGQNRLPLKFLAAAVYLSESDWGAPHRSMNRRRWRGTIAEQLGDIEKQGVLAGNSMASETVAKHENPLVRIFADDTNGYDGIDIFLAKDIRRREGSEDLDFNRRRDLEEAIKREDERYKGKQNDGG